MTSMGKCFISFFLLNGSIKPNGSKIIDLKSLLKPALIGKDDFDISS